MASMRAVSPNAGHLRSCNYNMHVCVCVMCVNVCVYVYVSESMYVHVCVCDAMCVNVRVCDCPFSLTIRATNFVLGSYLINITSLFKFQSYFLSS